MLIDCVIIRFDLEESSKLNKIISFIEQEKAKTKLKFCYKQAATSEHSYFLNLSGTIALVRVEHPMAPRDRVVGSWLAVFLLTAITVFRSLIFLIELFEHGPLLVCISYLSQGNG